MATKPQQASSKLKNGTGILREKIGKTGPLVRNGIMEAVGKLPGTGPLLKDAVATPTATLQVETRKLRTFILIWFGQMISLIGSGLTGFGLGVWVYQRTGSASQYTMIALFIMLPNIIFLPFAGALVDRWDRREMMIVSMLGAGMCSLAIALLLIIGELEIWHIYVATIVRSSFNTLQIPAYSSLPSLLVPKRHLGRASGMVQGAQAAATIASPFLAGMVIATLKIQGAIIIDLGTYLFAITTLLFVKIPRPKAAVGTGTLALEALSKVKSGTGLLVRSAINKTTGGTGRLGTASLGKTGVLVREALGNTKTLVKQAVGNVKLDEEKMDTGIFNSTDAISGTAPLAREMVGKSKGETSSLLKDSVLGWKFIKQRPGLLFMLVTFAAINFAVGMAQVLFAPLILSFSTPQALSRIVSCGGAGLLAGSILMSVWGGPKRRVTGAITAAVLVGFSVSIIGIRPSTYMIAIGMFGMLSVSPLLNGCTQAIWQTKTPQTLQGRVFAVRRMIAQCTSPIAFFLAGPLADKVFEPMFAQDGALSDSIGRLIGEGPGRGIGFMFMLSGMIAILIASLSYLHPRMRRVEHEIKDAA